MSHATRTTRSLLRRTLWWGFAASLLLHAGLLAVMVFGTVRGWLNQRPLLVVQTSSTYASRAAEDPQTPATVTINDDDPLPTDVQQQLAASLAATEQLSDAERITALDSATNRLDRISSDASIDDVAKRLQKWLGLTPRAADPAANPAANPAADNVAVATDSGDPPSPDATVMKFDFETAQLHDVRRVTPPDSRPQYFCVLLDADGRTIEVPLEEGEGEPIYALMEKIKAHPLLEKIYRQLAMPLLDQMVRAEQAATSAAGAARTQATGEETRAAPAADPVADDGAPDGTAAPH